MARSDVAFTIGTDGSDDARRCYLRPRGNPRQATLDGALIKPIMITVCADADDDGDADG